MTDEMPILARALQDFVRTARSPGEVWAWFTAREIDPDDLRGAMSYIADYADSRESAFLCGFVVGWQAHVALLAENSP